MSKRVLWVSQHSMHRVQMGALRRLFGPDVVVDSDPRPFDSAETVVRRVRDGGYDDCIVVGPISVLDQMGKLGLRPLWSEAEQVENPALADWVTRGRHYRFSCFRRWKRLIVEFEDLGPDAERRPDD